ncbi:hypothetical protein Golomagni_02057 [Golovinomyces magnicellulatus]|nr:hypothetical protein Golomagni_02057 [Golovinomyces magnicellulatus]
MSPAIIPPFEASHHLSEQQITATEEKDDGCSSSLSVEGIFGKLRAIFYDSCMPEAPKPLNASRLRFTKTTTPMSVPDMDSPIIQSASQCTDHMIIATWTATKGWADPELKPYGNFSLPPTSSCLHYSTQCFEGMKIYRGYDGALRLFRPDANCKRLLVSSHRVGLPAFDPREVEKLIIALAAVDGPKWLPKSRPGSCVYLRPSMIGSEAALGVATPNEVIFFIIATFMPPAVFPNGLRLLANNEGVRAWPGGFGYAKIGANYGPTLMATKQAKKKGFHQVLWLFEGAITEAGASNFFVIWRAPKNGRLQLVTAPLDDNKLILDGITRRSILQLVQERLSLSASPIKFDDKILETLEIVERNFTIDELVQAINEGRIFEAFASGTAYFVCPVYLINYKNRDYQIPISLGKSGVYTELFKRWLIEIIYGEKAHDWAVIVREDEDGDSFINSTGHK